MAIEDAGWHGLSPLLVALGLLIAFYPIVGAAVIGLILIVLFVLDGLAGAGFAFAMRPMEGWGWILFSGLLSLFVAVVLIAGWPLSTVWLVGLFVGLGLLFDGVALLILAHAVQR